MIKVIIKKIDSFALATAAAAVVFVLSGVGSALALVAKIFGNGTGTIKLNGLIQMSNPGIPMIIAYPFVSAVLTWVFASLLVGIVNVGLRMSGGLDVQCDVKRED
jgi:hypothetical protein